MQNLTIIKKMQNWAINLFIMQNSKILDGKIQPIQCIVGEIGRISKMVFCLRFLWESCWHGSGVVFHEYQKVVLENRIWVGLDTASRG